MEKIATFKDYSDNSLKCVFKDNNKIIEMSLLFNKEDKDVVCVPTHHFCNLGCKMCHLTNNKLNKKMEMIKYDSFIYGLFETLLKDGKRITEKKKLLISFMGVGEPLLNLKLVKEVYNNEKLIKDKLGYETIGYAISTMMPNRNIGELTKYIDDTSMPLKVHFSLHTPIDNKRYDLLPSTKVSVIEAMNLLKRYSDTLVKNKNFMDEYKKMHKSKVPVEIHYTLIDKINDSDEELEILYNILNKYKIPIKFITFNEINDLKRSKKIERWINKLSEIKGLKIKEYTPPGREIGSSCGEFTKHYYHEEIETKEEREEFELFRKKHEIK